MTKRKVRREDLTKLGFRGDQMPIVEAIQDVERKDATARAENSQRTRAAVAYLDQRIEQEKRREAERREQAADFDEVRARRGLLNSATVGTTPQPTLQERLRAERREYDPAPNGPTVATVRTRARGESQRLERGCGICGVVDVWVYGGRRSVLGRSGYLCGSCHRALDYWSAQIDNRIELGRELARKGATQLPATNHLALAVTQRLRDTRPDLVPEAVEVIEGWQSFCWVNRVFQAESPETQEPPSSSFGYLAPAKISEEGSDDAGS